MKVKLLSVTPDALNLLLRTKGTRLAHAEDPAKWNTKKRNEHLSYMRDTIKSSWEFVTYVFHISGVTRAFTHQLVRTRAGSYAQESQRTVDVSDHEVLEPKAIKSNRLLHLNWDQGSAQALASYRVLLQQGAAPQDARGLLPTNITTSIIAQFNLRTLHEMAKLRLCTRTQGEYQSVFREMRRLVVAEHPWVEKFGFMEVHCVAEGTCAFPRFGRKECKFYDPRLDRDAVSIDIRKRFWKESAQEARPVVRDGKTM